MPAVANCPDDNTLQQLLLGTLGDELTEKFGGHLLACETCVGRAGKLNLSDDLTLSLRDANTLAPDPNDPLVKQLRARLHHLRSVAPAANADRTQTLSMPTEASVSAQPRSESPAVATSFAFLSPPQQADELGRLGSYRILKVLGQGGMGVVFQAEDPRLGRLCAIKAMLPEVATKPGMKERFLREARAAAQIEHDNIIPVFQVDEERGAPYIAMPFLKGMSLEDWLRKKQKDGQSSSVSVSEALKVARQIARGLAAAHERGMIHRDIKPANVWLDASAGGRVKILDFGLARLEEAPGQQHFTQSGVIMGTPSYMAPEQAKGEPLDGRADVFSLGVILYRLCTGELPFRGRDTMSTLLMLATLDPPPPHEKNPAIPQPLSELVMKLLEKEPADRVPSAKEAARLLQGLEKSLAGGESAPGVTNQAAAQSGTSLRDVPHLAERGATLAAPRWGAIKTATESVLIRIPPQRRKPVALAAAGGFALLLAGIVLFWQMSRGGTVRIEILDDTITATVDQGGVTIKRGEGQKDIHLQPGDHGVRITHGELEFETEKFVLGKGDDVTLKIELLAGQVQVTRNGEPLGLTPVVRPSVPGPVAASPDVASNKKSTSYALQFDGDDHVIVSGIDWGPLPSYTFEAYASVDRLTDKVGFIVLSEKKAQLTINSSNYSRNWFLAFKYKDERLPGYLYGGTPAELKKRVHLAGVASGKQFRLYVDGKLAGTTVAEKELEPDLGGSLSFGGNFVGTIDGIRISRVARYDTPFTPPLRFEKDAETLALYQFDEGTGDYLADASGNGHHGKIAGATWVKADGSALDLKSEISNLKSAVPPAEWTSLFNGRDLAGWQPMKTVGPKQDMHEPASGGWEVVDGAIVCATSEAGWLKSAEQYEDFELELEFKLLANSNSDVFFRCPGTGRLSQTGLAAQLIDDGTTKTQLADASRCGALWGIAGPKVTAMRPLGEWNQMAVHCRGDHVRIVLNNTTTAEVRPLPDNRPRSGYLGLSNWYGEAKGMAFRNIRIRDIRPTAAAGKSPGTEASPPAANWTPRSAAEWTIRHGGKVWIGGRKDIARIEELPAEIGKLDLADLAGVKTFTDADAAAIANWPQIAGISVEGTAITDAGLRHLAKLGEKGSFNVRDTSITGEGFDAFVRIPLGAVVVDRCRLSPQGWHHLARVGKTIQWFLNGTNLDDAKLAEIIAMHPEIKVLWAPGTVLTDTSAERLATLTGLESVVLKSTGVTDEGLMKFATVKSLKSLDITHTKVTAAGVARFKEALPMCTIESN